mmetsp:Transcript_7932/g.23463  ORF Transcript_7932/g.23463 Transcript_7932/m.23463 type:complete len:279 (+) Transcript_7932:1057-1893(+)
MSSLSSVSSPSFALYPLTSSTKNGHSESSLRLSSIFKHAAMHDPARTTAFVTTSILSEKKSCSTSLALSSTASRNFSTRSAGTRARNSILGSSSESFSLLATNFASRVARTVATLGALIPGKDSSSLPSSSSILKSALLSLTARDPSAYPLASHSHPTSFESTSGFTSFQPASNSDNNHDTFQSSFVFANTSKHFGKFENLPKSFSHFSSNSMAQSARCNHHFFVSDSHLTQYIFSNSTRAESLIADAIVDANALERFSNSSSKKEAVLSLPFFSLLN